MRNMTTAIIIGITLIPLAVQADTFGWKFGTAFVNQAPNGYIQFQGDRVDVDDDLNLGDDNGVLIWTTLEHPVPIIPNIKLSRLSFDTKGQGTVSRSFTFGGETFDASAAIASEIKLDQIDLAFYYQVLDNVVETDLGLNLKYIDADASVRSLSDPNKAESTSFKGVLPMLYGRLGAKLPLTGLSAGVEGGGVYYDGSTIGEYTVKLTYETSFHVGVEAAYRGQIVDLDNFDGVSSDLRINGLYLGLFAHI